MCWTFVTRELNRKTLNYLRIISLFLVHLIIGLIAIISTVLPKGWMSDSLYYPLYMELKYFVSYQFSRYSKYFNIIYICCDSQFILVQKCKNIGELFTKSYSEWCFCLRGFVNLLRKHIQSHFKGKMKVSKRLRGLLESIINFQTASLSSKKCFHKVLRI